MKEGDLVLCVVEKVTNTVTHVRLPNGEVGTIISSEIAPGRIKFMRQYVTPNKVIVCKVLGVSNGHVHLSLRRVNAKEKKEVLQKYKQEKAIHTAIKNLLKEKAEEVISKIKENFESLTDFISQASSNEEILKKFIPKEHHEKIKKIAEKRKKLSSINYLLNLKCLGENGIGRIKNALSVSEKKLSIVYISAGKFKLTLESENLKEGKKKTQEIIKKIEDLSRKNACEFSAKEMR